MTISALYLGFVSHQRFAPRAHSLRYAMFQTLLDLDELDALATVPLGELGPFQAAAE